MTDTASSLLSAKGVIFDVDGTLVDSVDFHAEAWQRTFQHFGFDIECGAIRSQIGKGGDQLMPEFLSPEVIYRQGKDIEAYRKELFKHDYMDRVRGFAGVPNLFKFLLDRGLKVGLGSSAKGEELEIYKKIAGIEDLIHAQTTSDDAEKSKPDPDIFTAALDRLSLPAEAVIVVGDSPWDTIAARKAGMQSIALLCGGFLDRDLREAGPVAVFKDPEALLAALQQG